MLLFLAASALAVPLQLPHQGRLVDSGGVPLSGPHDLEVALFTDQTGGSAFWTELHAGTAIDEGYFAIRLGSLSSLDASDLDVAAVWIEMRVDGNVVGDRKPLGSVPYAFLAHSVSGGVVDASEIRVDGNVVVDSSGTLVAPIGGSTLGDLSCSADQIALFDGTDWGCGTPSNTVDFDDLANVPLELLDGDDDTLAGIVCNDGELLVYSTSFSAWGCTNDLTAGTTIGGQGIVTDWSNLPSIPADFADGVDDTLSDTDVENIADTAGFVRDSALASVATSGDYADLSGAPALADIATSGDYSDLSNAPVLASVATSGDYGDLSGAPVLATVATSGDYTDLSGTPSLAAVATSGDYSDLSGTPTLALVATSGDYSDLTGTPTLSTVAGSGDFADLINVPADLADGDDDTQLTEAEVEAFVENGAIDLAGSLRVGATTATCNAGAKGILRYRAPVGLEICDGGNWVSARPQPIFWRGGCGSNGTLVNTWHYFCTRPMTRPR